jgi:hypothetical protein
MRSRLGVPPLLCPVEEVVRPKSHRTAPRLSGPRINLSHGMHFCIYQVSINPYKLRPAIDNWPLEKIMMSCGGVVFEVHDSLNNHITGWVRDAPKFECSAWATEAEEPSLEGRNVEIALIENVLGI